MEGLETLTAYLCLISTLFIGKALEFAEIAWWGATAYFAVVKPVLKYLKERGE